MKTRVFLTLLILGCWLSLASEASRGQAVPDAPTFVDSGIATFTPVRNGAMAWGDSDNDGDLDLLVTGNSSASLSSSPVTKLYLKNPGNAYFEVPAGTTNLIGVQRSAAAWGDFNNDGRLDVLLSGETAAGMRLTRIYRNEGNNQFADISANLADMRDSAVAWGDYDNDGRLDVVIAGDSSAGAVTQLYRNTANGTFSLVNVSLPGVINGSLAWSDFNRDGRLDLLIVGPGISKVYRNNGLGSFVEVTAGLSILNVSAAAAWGDVNVDGWPDIALVGKSDVVAVAKVYRNNGDGTFTDLPNTGLTPVGSGASVAWADYDNDGRSDLLLNGNWDVSPRLFRNKGDNTFTAVESGLPAIASETLAWGDFNNSGQLDVGLIGNDLAGLLYARIYSNTLTTANAAPGVPVSLTVAFPEKQAQLRWSAPIDDHTPAAALSYSVRVGTTPGGADIISPLALSNGRKQIPAPGSSVTTTARLNLKSGAYYWSVQAVDSAYVGSAFAAEAMFIVPYYTYLPVVTLNAITYFPGTTELEPNNAASQANGPLASGQTIAGTHNDQWDTFSVYLPVAGTVSVNLQTPRTNKMQLQVYYQSTADPARLYDPTPPYQVNYTGAAGWYYIFIFNEAPFNTDAYTLIANYP